MRGVNLNIQSKVAERSRNVNLNAQSKVAERSRSTYPPRPTGTPPLKGRGTHYRHFINEKVKSKVTE